MPIQFEVPLSATPDDSDDSDDSATDVSFQVATMAVDSDGAMSTSKAKCTRSTEEASSDGDSKESTDEEARKIHFFFGPDAIVGDTGCAGNNLPPLPRQKSTLQPNHGNIKDSTNAVAKRNNDSGTNQGTTKVNVRKHHAVRSERTQTNSGMPMATQNSSLETIEGNTEGPNNPSRPALQRRRWARRSTTTASSSTSRYTELLVIFCQTCGHGETTSVCKICGSPIYVPTSAKGSSAEVRLYPRAHTSNEQVPPMATRSHSLRNRHRADDVKEGVYSDQSDISL